VYTDKRQVAIDAIQLPFGFCSHAAIVKETAGKVAAVMTLIYGNSDRGLTRLVAEISRLAAATTVEMLASDGLKADMTAEVFATLQSLSSSLFCEDAGYVDAVRSTLWFPSAGLESGSAQFGFHAAAGRDGTAGEVASGTRDERLLQYTQPGLCVRGESSHTFLCMLLCP